MARLAIVDKDDNVIGEEKWSEVYGKGLIHRLVRILLFNDRNELLLQWRDETRDTFPNTWDQSAGGHVDAGENYDTAAYRELEEELGVKDVKLEFIDKFYTEGQIGEKIIKRFNGIYRAYYSGDFVLQDDEVSKVQWFTQKDILEGLENNPEMFTLGLRKILEDYKEKLWLQK